MLGGGWRKSSFSGAGNCVEARHQDGKVEVRDSKAPDAGSLATSEESWAEFLAGLPVAAWPVPAWPPPERRVRGLIAPYLDRPG